jgi:hypothetical protein
MKIKHLLLSFLWIPFFATAQHLAYNQYELLNKEGLKGNPGSVENQYDDIKGTAFFSPQWLSAVAFTEKGTQYTGLKIKFDQYRNKLFANVHDTLYDLGSARIARVVLYPNPADTGVNYVFQKGFSTGSIRSDQYVRVLAAGKLTFLKQTTLEVKEVNEDSPLSKVKKFVSQEYYYLVREGQATQVRLNKKVLEKEMADKWNEVSKYAKEKEVSFSEEDGWAYLVKYYNSVSPL